MAKTKMILNSSARKYFAALTAGFILTFASAAHGAVNVVVSTDNSGTTTLSNADREGRKDSSAIGSASTSYTTIGAGGTSGQRFRGSTNAKAGASYSQTIDFTTTWTFTADAGFVYDVTLTPEFHGILIIGDLQADESGDNAIFSDFTASLEQNSTPVANTLDLTGGNRFTDGFNTVDDTATQSFIGLTGDNTFTLQYTGTISVATNTGVLANDKTVSSARWGMDGTLDGIGTNFQDSFFDYGTAGARDDDGFFVDAAVTVTAVPEPSAAALILAMAGLTVVGYRRRR
jgi:hypothetical protein